MVTRIHKSTPRRLFLREHRKAKGLDATQVAGRLGMERESLLRLEREAQTRCSPEKQAAYAQALGIEPEDLWRPPSDPLLDRIVADAPKEDRELVENMIRRIGRR